MMKMPNFSLLTVGLTIMLGLWTGFAISSGGMRGFAVAMALSVLPAAGGYLAGRFDQAQRRACVQSIRSRHESK